MNVIAVISPMLLTVVMHSMSLIIPTLLPTPSKYLIV